MTGIFWVCNLDLMPTAYWRHSLSKVCVVLSDQSHRSVSTSPSQLCEYGVMHLLHTPSIHLKMCFKCLVRLLKAEICSSFSCLNCQNCSTYFAERHLLNGQTHCLKAVHPVFNSGELQPEYN